MGQILFLASDARFISRTQQRLQAALGDWTVETIAGAALAFQSTVAQTRRNFTISFDEFCTLSFIHRFGQPSNEPAAPKTVEQIWALYVDGGEKDDDLDEEGNVMRKSWNNVRIDSLEMFSSLLFLLPRRGDDRKKLFTCFQLFDLKRVSYLGRGDILTLLLCVFGGLHVCTEGAVLLPKISELEFIIQAILEEKNLVSYERFDFQLLCECYDELEQTSIVGIVCHEGINRLGALTRPQSYTERQGRKMAPTRYQEEQNDFSASLGTLKRGDRKTDVWHGTRDSWIESLFYASIDRKIFKSAFFDYPDKDLPNRRSLPPPRPSPTDLEEWHAVVKTLSPGIFQEKMMDLDCDMLDLSGEKGGLIAQQVELLTVYLNMNNYRKLHTMNVAHCNLRENGTRLVCNGLVLNQTIKHLNCAENAMGPEGAKALATFLAGNHTLETLDVGVNKISDGGATEIALVVEQHKNTTLQELNVRGNNIGREGGKSFGRAIGGNHPSLHTLNMKDNGIDCLGGESIGIGLATNSVLTQLDLSKNRLYSSGAISIARTLGGRNKSLASLELGYNNIKMRGAMAFAGMLRTNKALTNLNLSANKLGFEYYERPKRKPVSDSPAQMMPHRYSPHGVCALVEALILKNTTLVYINLSMNHIDHVLGNTLYKLLGERVTQNGVPCTLKSINLSGNEMNENVSRMLATKYAFVDTTKQIHMKQISAASMATPVTVYGETTDENVGEGMLSTVGLSRAHLRKK